MKEKKKKNKNEFIALLFVKNTVAEPAEQEGKKKCPEKNAVISMTVPSVNVVFVVFFFACFSLFSSACAHPLDSPV